VHLTPREEERLLLAAAADLARRRLARGAPLGATEATALVCDEICEMAWDGVPLEEVIDRARRIVPAGALLPGVAALMPVLEVEALFPWGSTLVHVDLPFGRPRPAVVAAAGTAVLAPGAARHPARLRNTGPRDVWISSHFPLDQVNPAVEVSGAPGGCRLDLPAGEALRVRAGEEREVIVVETAAAQAPSPGQAEPRGHTRAPGQES
jgi:urease subunit gamma/beta